VKSGVSSFGVPPGHTVRESRLPREALDEMLRQAGVMRVETVHQLFDVAQLVVHQPLPQGSSVAVVTNSDALGALAADACLSWGLDVVHGPVAVGSAATAPEFRAALQSAFDDEVDSVVVGFIPPLVTLDIEVAQALAEVAGASDKACVATFLGMRGLTEALSSGSRTVPPTRLPRTRCEPWWPPPATRPGAAVTAATESRPGRSTATSPRRSSPSGRRRARTASG
jgi:hypothetical protein